MPAIVIVLVGFVAGLFTMAIVSFYKWFLKNWNNGLI
jgi:uncharacterized integral membrane protein